MTVEGIGKDQVFQLDVAGVGDGDRIGDLVADLERVVIVDGDGFPVALDLGRLFHFDLGVLGRSFTKEADELVPVLCDNSVAARICQDRSHFDRAGQLRAFDLLGCLIPLGVPGIKALDRCQRDLGQQARFVADFVALLHAVFAHGLLCAGTSARDVGHIMFALGVNLGIDVGIARVPFAIDIIVNAIGGSQINGYRAATLDIVQSRSVGIAMLDPIAAGFPIHQGRLNSVLDVR